MTNTSKHFKLDEKFTISRDKHNWILIEGLNTCNPHRHYYSKLEFLCKGLLDIVAKDSIEALSTSESENTFTANRMDILMATIINNLKLYIEGVTNEQKRTA